MFSLLCFLKLPWPIRGHILDAMKSLHYMVNQICLHGNVTKGKWSSFRVREMFPILIYFNQGWLKHFCTFFLAMPSKWLKICPFLQWWKFHERPLPLISIQNSCEFCYTATLPELTLSYLTEPQFWTHLLQSVDIEHFPGVVFIPLEVSAWSIYLH